MKSVLTFAIASISTIPVLNCPNAFAGDDDIWGMYELISATNKFVDTGEVINSYGEHPKGYITYGKEGRMLVLITYDGRVKPSDVLKTSVEERDSLYRSMTAYGGTYTYDGHQMQHHVDISWDETRSGTTVTRTVTREGKRLTYVTEPFPSRNRDTLGRIVVQTLTWEKLPELR